MGLKNAMVSIFRLFLHFCGIHSKWHFEHSEKSHVIYPMGKPMTPHLLRYQGFAVAYYSFTLDALDLRHPRLLQH
jgi:hypothetical protein